ncbi:MAG: hypothetical protein KAG53_02960 [Endozoicomonadaceae bacterium]|nr:hypothetical protein [Endozoicomonadaceae bacterium]
MTDLKNRIHHAQQSATLAVNRELIVLYWQIGNDIYFSKVGGTGLALKGNRALGSRSAYCFS